MAENSGDKNQKNLAKRTHEMMESLATRDSLTGLHNRRYFIKQIDSAMASENGTLMILDIDKFKDINDSYGHIAGDKILMSVSRILQDNVQIIGDGGGADSVARLGGDEFGIFLKKFSDPVLVSERVEKIRYAVEKSFVEDQGRTIRATISIGITFKNPNELAEDLIRRADKALYDAKSGGKNKHVISNNDA